MTPGELREILLVLSEFRVARYKDKEIELEIPTLAGPPPMPETRSLDEVAKSASAAAAGMTREEYDDVLFASAGGPSGGLGRVPVKE